MHLERLNTGERIACIGAIVLLISTFLDWFVVEIPDSSGVKFFLDGVGQSAWESLDIIPVVLVVVIVITLGAVFLRLGGVTYWSPVRADAVIMILGLSAALLILYRIVDPPGFGSFRGLFGNVSAEGSVRFGIFLGFLAAVGVAFGGYRAMREGSTPVGLAELQDEGL